jgi:hypothetical protein
MPETWARLPLSKLPRDCWALKERRKQLRYISSKNEQTNEVMTTVKDILPEEEVSDNNVEMTDEKKSQEMKIVEWKDEFDSFLLFSTQTETVVLSTVDDLTEVCLVFLSASSS